MPRRAMLHVTHETLLPSASLAACPGQPNASGNGRVLEMILNSLVMEQNDSLCLLYGAPDAWFDSGQPLGITDLHTSWGPFSFQLTPEEGKVRFLSVHFMNTREPFRHGFF